MQESEPRPRKRLAIPPIVIFLIGVAAAAYFAMQHDYVAAGVSFAIAIGGIAGYRHGAIRTAAAIAGFVLAAAFAPQLGRMIEVKLTMLLGTSGLLNRGIAIGACGLAIILVVAIIASLLTSLLFADRKSPAAWDRWTGFGFGIVQTAAAALLLLGGILVIEPMQRQQVQSDTIENPVVKGIISTAQHTRNSLLGPVIEEYNPFVRVPQLNKLEQIQKSVQVFSNPQRVHGILQSPEIQRLRKDPNVNRAIAKLQSDEKISEIINSNEPMDQKKIMTIMNSNTVLELIDQPGFADEFSNVMKSININVQ